MHVHNGKKKILHLLVGSAIMLLPSVAFAATTIGDAISVGTTLTVGGATTISGAATLSSTLSVSGLSTLTGGFVSSASSSIGSSLNVTGNLNASSSLFVSGSSVLLGNVGIGFSPTGAAQLHVQATSTTAIPLIVQDSNSGVIFKASSSTVLAFSGSLTNGLINALEVGGTKLGGVVLPGGGLFSIYRNSTNIAMQIGSGTLDFGDGTVSSSYSGSSGITLNQQSGFNLGKLYIDNSGNFSASGTVRAYSNILPGVNATPNIGAYGKAFGSVFASGTLSVGGAAGATTTVNLGTPGSTLSGGTCFNIASASGTPMSFYIFGGDLKITVENNACR